MRDALVDDNEGDLRLSSCLVVQLSEGLAELPDLLVNDLISLGITDTIAEDNEVGREVALMVSGKDFDGLLKRVLHLSLNDLLALPLNDVFRVVLAHLLVGARSETNDRVGACVANIDSDQHRSHVVHDLRELEMEEVAFNLRIDLTQDVGGLTHVEFKAIASGDNLRWDLKLMEELLVHLVVVLLTKHDHDDLGVSEHTVWSIHHVIKELTFDLSVVIFSLKLDEVGLLNFDLERIARLHKRVVNVVSDLEVRALPRVGPLWVLIDHHPFTLEQVHSLLNRQALQ